MTRLLFAGRIFDRTAVLEKGEYDGCTFNGCDFSGADLSCCLFIDCTFAGCNLSMAKLTETVFRDVVFRECKMLGLRFERCNEHGTSFSFEDCLLGHSSFCGVKMPGTVFCRTQLREADFTEADLSGAVFDGCDLSGAVFDHTSLERADLSTAFGYTIDPEANSIRKARFSLSGVAGLLDKYGIRIEE